MSTALALVNRVRAKRREGTSTILTDKTGEAYLDLVNAAIHSVLEQRTWDFQQRYNGVLTLIPPFSGTLFVAPFGTLISFQDYLGTIDTLAGQFVTRIVPLGDTRYGNTSFRIFTGTLVGTTVVGVLEENWQGDAVGHTGWNTFTWEYLLPATVRQVTGVSLQDRDDPLEFSSTPEEYDRAFPRPFDDLGPPEVVVVGGEIRNTDINGSPNQAYGLALRVWPVPDLEYRLDYSYILRQPVLTTETDNLDRVPPAVEDLIVDLAAARAIIELEKDVTNGIPIEQKILRDVDRLYRNHKPDVGQRPQILSHDQVNRNPNRLLYLPRSVAGLQGS